MQIRTVQHGQIACERYAAVGRLDVFGVDRGQFIDQQGFQPRGHSAKKESEEGVLMWRVF